MIFMELIPLKKRRKRKNMNRNAEFFQHFINAIEKTAEFSAVFYYIYLVTII